MLPDWEEIIHLQKDRIYMMETLVIRDCHYVNMGGTETMATVIQFGGVTLETREYVNFVSGELN